MIKITTQKYPEVGIDFNLFFLSFSKANNSFMRKIGKLFHKARLAKVNLFLQNIAIVLAGTWAIYIFIYKEYYVPQHSPIHINVDPTIKIVGELDSAYQVLLSISVSNKSKRTSRTFIPAFIIYGYKYYGPLNEYQFLENRIKNFNEILKQNRIAVAKDIFSPKKMEVVTVSTFLSSTYIPSNVTLKQEILFYVEKDKFDFLTAVIRVPVTGNINSDKQMAYEIIKDGITTRTFWFEDSTKADSFNKKNSIKNIDEFSYYDEYKEFSKKEDFYEFISFIHLSLAN